MKLHRQLILLGLAALLPLVVLSAILGASALRQAQRAMRHDASERVSDITAGVDRELKAEIEVLQTLANSPLMDGRIDDRRFDDMAGRLLRDRPLWIAVTLTDPDGSRRVDLPPLPANVPRKVVDRESQAQAVRTGKPVVGRILRGPRGRAAFAIFVPVVRQGRVVSVLDAVVRPDAVRALLLANGLPRDWRAGVIDQAHRVVTRSIAVPDVATRPANPNAVAAMARGRQGLYRTIGVEGVPLVTAFAIMPATGWSVHVSLPESRYEAPLVRSLWLVGAGGAISLLLAGLFLWLLVRELQLRQGQQAALEEGVRLEALGRMTGGVAHDFNNLLMIIQGSAELLRRRMADQERPTAWADAILAAAQRGQTLTRQLLAFGRRSAHEPVGFSLQERAVELLSLLRRSVSSEVVAHLTVPETTWPIYADPDALEVALINLAVNASDAMPEGGVLTIVAANISMHRGRDEGAGLVGDYVALSVTDTGVGIPKEHIGHVFEPFYTTKAPGKGTGLGLSQVYGFARQSSGAVTVRSREGEGSTVTLYLPRLARPLDSVAPAVGGGEPSRGEGRVLLVEDNVAVAEVTGDLLAGAGYVVTWARDGEEALRRLGDGESVDVVLSDIVIDGGMSGIDLARAIVERRPDLPVVLMTGYSEAVARGGAQGLVVLAKPFTREEVVAALRRARAGVAG